MGTGIARIFTGTPHNAAELVSNYQVVRQATERLCAPLETEDYVLQAMADVSPPKWHLGHVSWFFEAFLLLPYLSGYKQTNPRYQYLFNSYYNGVGQQFPRPDRGKLSRPTVAEVYEFRSHIDRAMLDLVEVTDPRDLAGLGSLMSLGLNHEQQHQELLVTDIKYNLAFNPLWPAFHDREVPRGTVTSPVRWVELSGGVREVGHDRNGFAFDNEWPRHRTYLRPYRLASRPVTNGEYVEFMEADGYRRSELWLSDGWRVIQDRRWVAPQYWERIDGGWWYQTLSGMQPMDEHAPVVHVSYYEADAYARWRDSRLPTEHEWEHAADGQAVQGNFLESGVLQPLPAESDGSRLEQLFGDVWEWTQSPYGPYPGYRPLDGTLGEYNGKFMLNQMVLRGGSCATPRSHIRASYRNFFPPDARWQFSGIRLANDA